MKIISITGTKGKTTVSRILDHVIHSLGETTLRVDTDGHFINEKQKSTLEDARNLYSKAPTVCPGKYLITMKDSFPNFYAILETAFGSSGKHGLGYSFHDIGIFTNVFEDHIDMDRIKTRGDIARAKSFIFREIGKGGFAIFNADDEFVCSQLSEIPANRNITLIPVGKSFSHFPLKQHLQQQGIAISERGGNIVKLSLQGEEVLINTSSVSWTFNNTYLPSVYNLMFIVAGLHAMGRTFLSSNAIDLLSKSSLDSHGGRLTLLKNKKGINILIDYAHEKYSLKEIGDLGRKLSKNNRVIGVIRLAPDRTNQLIQETGRFIADCFDSFIIYDKIDGVTRKKFEGKHVNINREAGEVSQLLSESVRSQKSPDLVENIIYEKDAIARAAQIAKDDDTVVVICGDDHKRTLQWVKEYFQATLT